MMELLHALGELTAALEKLTEKLGSGYLESFEPLENIRFEDVRAKLSELSRAGHAAEVRELIQKHGAQKLSDIPESDYAALLKEAEAMENAT